MTRRASCCCGQCTIDVDGDPALNAVCHCGHTGVTVSNDGRCAWVGLPDGWRTSL